MDIHIEQVRPELTLRLRQQVLYPDQKLSDMKLEEDADGWHFAAFYNGFIVGVVSLFKREGTFQFRKLAVAGHVQKMGVGSRLLACITDFARQENADVIWCNARTTAIEFYLKAGFVQTNRIFSKNGFDYQIMEKSLSVKKNRPVIQAGPIK